MLLGVIFRLFNSPHQISENNLLIDFLPSAIGSGLGFGIVLLIVAAVRKIKNKKPTKAAYINYFIISTALLLLSLIPKIKIGF